MPDGTWRVVPLGSEVLLQRGFDTTKKSQRNGTVPVVSSSGVRSFHDEAGARGPGVVLGRKGQVGTVFYIPGDYWPHDTTLWVRDFKGNDPRFVYYFFCSIRYMLKQLDHGTANPTLNRNHLHPIPVAWPDVQEQLRIGRVLGALDDKIDLNREMNRTLEAMAHAIFRSWFVAFDPVVAKSEGREPFGMDAETAALFPDRFVESEVGPVPEGWEVVPTASLARYVNGRAFTKNASGTGRMVIRIAELNSGPGASTIYNDLADVPVDHVAQPGDILFAWSGSLGVYRWTLPEAIINQHIFKVIPDGVPDWFVYCHLSAVMPVYRAIAAGKATTMGHIKRSHLSETTAIRPRTPELLARADAIVRPIWDLWLNNELESQTLAALRDLLLPKLLSGEIRVPEAAEMVEDVA